LHIRRLYDAGKASGRALAERFGVGQSQIMRIVHRKSWPKRHIVYKGKSYTTGKLSQELGGTDCVIRARLRRGWPIERAISQPIHPRPNARKA
jgi:hypothetical protein